jgi:serine O-acetyltransferase
MSYPDMGLRFRAKVALREITDHFRSWLNLGLYHAYLAHDMRALFSCDIGQKLPRSTSLPHPIGIVIGSRAEIGEGVKIYHNVTIGRKVKSDRAYPQVGDNVDIYSGAVIAGDVTIGDNATIAANAVVLDDVPEGGVAAGVPAEIIDTADRSLEFTS